MASSTAPLCNLSLPTLQEQLDRARKTKAVFAAGQEARPLTAEEEERLRDEHSAATWGSGGSSATRVGSFPSREASSADNGGWETDDEGGEGTPESSSETDRGRLAGNEGPLTTDLPSPPPLPQPNTLSHANLPSPSPPPTAPSSPSMPSARTRFNRVLSDDAPAAFVPPTLILPSRSSRRQPASTLLTSESDEGGGDRRRRPALVSKDIGQTTTARPALVVQRLVPVASARKPLGRATSLPAAPPPSPATSSPSSVSTDSASSPNLSLSATLPSPSSSLPVPLHSRSRSGLFFHTPPASPPTSAPPSPTLSFRRDPKLIRVDSLPQCPPAGSWMLPARRRSPTEQSSFGVLYGEEEDGETEHETLSDHFEPSIFASARSNSISSLSSASSQRISSRSQFDDLVLASPISSTRSSPRLSPHCLSATFTLTSPSVVPHSQPSAAPLAIEAPAIAPLPNLPAPHRSPTHYRTRGVPVGREQLRQQQESRRRLAEAARSKEDAGDVGSSLSSGEETAVVTETLGVTNRAVPSQLVPTRMPRPALLRRMFSMG